MDEVKRYAAVSCVAELAPTGKKHVLQTRSKFPTAFIGQGYSLRRGYARTFFERKKRRLKKAHDSSAALPILRTQKLSNPEQQRGRGEEDEVPPRAAPGGV